MKDKIFNVEMLHVPRLRESCILDIITPDRCNAWSIHLSKKELEKLLHVLERAKNQMEGKEDLCDICE
jgi:hypothetical protein